MEYYNNLAPFPPFDTEMVEDLKDFIKMEQKERTMYDELPVVCCRHCLDLFVIVDELGNDICGRCGSVNEILIFDNIDVYLEEKENINNTA
ncbi:MAG: hypothetical protein ACSLE0_23300 [Chitinophagaceae bacterium]